MAESLDLSHDDLTFLLRAHEAGWRLVPVEPTVDMAKAMSGDFRYPRQMWEAALQAAPPLVRPMDDDADDEP